MAKLGNFIKILGFLTVIGTVLSKLMPLVKDQNPKLKKKMDHIGSLLNELKDEIVDLSASAATAVKRKK